MRALAFDFAPRSSALHRVLNVLLLGAVCAALYVANGWFVFARQHDTWEAGQAAAAKSQRTGGADDANRKVRAAQEEAEVAYANKVIERLALPWDRLFNAMEATVDEQVVLLGVEPDVDKRSITVTAEARNLVAMLAYARRLGANALFRDVHVQSHQLQVQDPQHPVRFVLGARWLPGAEK
jgi:Tfp pilus assembly protein PilN